MADNDDNNWIGDEVCMVFDGESGNALMAFDFTPDELDRQAALRRGRGWFTIDPSPFLLGVNGT